VSASFRGRWCCYAEPQPGGPLPQESDSAAAPRLWSWLGLRTRSGGPTVVAGSNCLWKSRMNHRLFQTTRYAYGIDVNRPDYNECTHHHIPTVASTCSCVIYRSCSTPNSSGHLQRNPTAALWRILAGHLCLNKLSFPLLSPRKYAFLCVCGEWLGFKRIVSGNDHNSYYHEMFVREYQLCLLRESAKRTVSMKRPRNQMIVENNDVLDSQEF
jgi:hypothetical protein